MTIPEFHTKRLLLKGISIDDADSYEKNFVDYDVIRFLSRQVPWPYPSGGVRTYLEHVILPFQGLSRWTWGIFRLEHPKDVIGCVDLWRKGIPEHRGFWLAKKYWGQGYMLEAVHPITEYAFTSLNFQKLIFSNAVANIASRRIKEKMGARFLGRRPSQFVDPTCTEGELWEILKEDWIRVHKNKSVSS